MTTNVVRIDSFSRRSNTALLGIPRGGAKLFTLATKKDRDMARLRKAERKFALAKSMGEREGTSHRVSLMMMQLAMTPDPALRVVQAEAGTWLWVHLGVTAHDQHGRRIGSRPPRS